jgi:hypothetical protein
VVVVLVMLVVTVLDGTGVAVGDGTKGAPEVVTETAAVVSVDVGAALHAARASSSIEVSARRTGRRRHVG